MGERDRESTYAKLSAGISGQKEKSCFKKIENMIIVLFALKMRREI